MYGATLDHVPPGHKDRLPDKVTVKPFSSELYTGLSRQFREQISGPDLNDFRTDINFTFTTAYGANSCLALWR